MTMIKVYYQSRVLVSEPVFLATDTCPTRGTDDVRLNLYPRVHYSLTKSP